MASRENQNLQIIVIALLIFFLLTVGGLVWVNSNRKAAVARATELEERTREAQSAQRQLQEEANRYKVMSGYSEADASATIEKQFEEDVERWMKSFDESSRNYRAALRIMVDENRKLTISEGDAKEKAKSLDADLIKIEKQKEEQIKEFQAKANKAQSDLAAEQSKFDKQYREMTAKNREIAAQLQDQRDRYEQQLDALRSEKRTLEEQIEKLDRTIVVMKGKIPNPDPFAQPADGLVRWVNQRTGTVWINLGESDGLRPQVTFTIFSSDQDDALTATQKATIEVTRLLSAHMAEARITSDIPTDPVLEGDKIYSQVWSPGRRTSFAITGFVDLDGDGRGDIERLKTVIRLNNGVVDAVPGPNGTMDGKLSANTRYLILGDYPDQARQDDLRRSWEVMSKEADTFGIEPIQLDDFLELMGWKQERTSVQLGDGSRASDFPPEKTDPAEYKPGKGNNIFRPRKPQPTY